MNKLVIMSFAALCAVAAVAETQSQGTPKKRGPGKVAMAGGFLNAPVKGKTLCLLNKQKIVSADALDELAKRIAMITMVPVSVSDTPLENAPVTITLIDSETEPRMLVAPEDGWGRLNLRKVLGDSPTDEVTAARLKKELWRVFSYTLGAGNPMMQPALMRVVTDNAGLDAHPFLEPFPESLNIILNGARAWGLDRARIVTYRRACQEGWAPMPTNEIQKAIWERAKAEQSANPTKGIPIKYDPKVGK